MQYSGSMVYTNYTALIRSVWGVEQPGERLLIDTGNVFWQVEYA